MQRFDCSLNVRTNTRQCFELLNARSVNNKAIALNNLMTDNDIDTIVITETRNALSTDIPLGLPGLHNS